MTTLQQPPHAVQHAAATTAGPQSGAFAPTDIFESRHNGPDAHETREMLAALGYASLEAFTDAVVPHAIRRRDAMRLPAPLTERQALARMRELAGMNQVWRSCIGTGYHGTVTPPVIQRTILENPCWYTQYTPYQAEIAQGRLEALLNFQTMVSDLTGLPLAGASLLDEATAAAEAMTMALNIAGTRGRSFFADSGCHPQTIELLRTRAKAAGIRLDTGHADAIDWSKADYAGVLVQYPATDGRIECFEGLATRAHAVGAVVVAACDPLALTLLRPPGEWGADIAVGSMQRFGVPMGFGGPHAAYIATHTEHSRRMPGRIIGISRDSHGHPALRMAIQTREQHIKRDRATSNICTAQALLAIMASMYGVYHGPDGLRRIARRVHAAAMALAVALTDQGHRLWDADSPAGEPLFFDTLRVRTAVEPSTVLARAAEVKINLRDFGDGTLGVTLDETVDAKLVRDLIWAFAAARPDMPGTARTDDELSALAQRHAQARMPGAFPGKFARASAFMTHPVFNTHHSETEILRYITKLQGRDLSLANTMIALGSCTMKLNAAAEMVPVTMPGFSELHPFAPTDQARGYHEMFRELEAWLADITGLAAVSLQPNAGSQGEYAGLLVLKAYHESRGHHHRDVCLIPESAHGTNPASAVMAGMKVVSVAVTPHGAVDLADLRAKVEQHADRLAALMVTYPSTCGVFESHIRDVCALIHEHGGQVYMDGANMNAQVGLTSPGLCGADVCHLNLHKTFCIPHGGGGPGMGPICVAEHLKPFLPTHPVRNPANAGRHAHAVGPVSAAPYGSPSILPISYAYILMMGHAGLTRATQLAILNANYMASRLRGHYDVLFVADPAQHTPDPAAARHCAHEFVIDCRPFKKSAGIEIDDIAKRLIDFGFHAPTMSWPVPGTLMIEPTESESRAELDRFCDALIAIRAEIARVERGDWPRESNPLKHAPHTIADVSRDDWTRPYPRQLAAYPADWLRDAKFWPHVGRVDNPYGDRNLVCTCQSVTELAS